MIRDRGNIKWTAMMLPEHVKMLSSWQEEDNQVKRPKLEGWELELIADEIERAYKSMTTIKLTYWRNGYIKDDYGKVITIDNKSQAIVIDDPFGTTRYRFDEIVAVSLID